MLDKLLYAFAGAAIGWLLQQYRLARSEEIALLNEHIKDLERLGEAASAYWLKSPDSENEERQLAAKVKAAHAATTLLYPNICRMCGDRSPIYTEQYQELFSTATGGQFESSSRELNVGRAIETADVAARLIHTLRLTRTEIVSLKRLWVSIWNWTLARFRALIDEFRKCRLPW